MNTDMFLDNPNYREYVRLLKELHFLMLEGKEDTEEAEVLRDKMDKPWYNLSPQEMDRVAIMSSGLSMIEGAELFRQVPPIERSREWLGPQLEAAWKSRDWDTLLALLRNGPDFIPSDVIAYFRARAYADLGLPDIALLFYDYAARLNPQNVGYPVSAMLALVQSGKIEEAVGRANRLIANKNAHPHQMFVSAEVLYDSAGTMAKQEARSVFTRVIAVLQTALEKESKSPNARYLPLVIAASMMMAMCYDNLGQTKMAIQTLDRLLKLDPDNTDALAIRGLLRYGTAPEAAITDFEKAIEDQSLLIWPYYFVGYWSLVRQDYQKCLQMCQRAIDILQQLDHSDIVLPGSENPAYEVKSLPTVTDKPIMIAQLLEWIAIALYSLGNAPESVRKLFEEAIIADPRNEEIRRNFEIFQDRVSSVAQSSVEWQISRPSIKQAKRKAELYQRLQRLPVSDEPSPLAPVAA